MGDLFITVSVYVSGRGVSLGDLGVGRSVGTSDHLGIATSVAQVENRKNNTVPLCRSIAILNASRFAS